MYATRDGLKNPGSLMAVPRGRAGRTGSDNGYDVNDRAFMPPVVRPILRPAIVQISNKSAHSFEICGRSARSESIMIEEVELTPTALRARENALFEVLEGHVGFRDRLYRDGT
jgi:hypothetical protein